MGVQTDAPLRRTVMLFGGIRVVEKACEAYGYELPEETRRIFTRYRKTHNDGVFDAYAPEKCAARRTGIITGLPDAYGRGRIIGDYRRVALFGVERLVAGKHAERAQLETRMDEETIRLREELAWDACPRSLTSPLSGMCVSAMVIGKQMQFFGARCNLAKALLYAINGGRDETTGTQVGPEMEPITAEVLDYDEVMERFDLALEWVAGLYVRTLNVIHYMHDRYAYESIQMALHDRDVVRTKACGTAGLSVCADSFSAIRFARVRPIRDDRRIAGDFGIEGEYPAFGNDDDPVDDIAADLVRRFMELLSAQQTYRDSTPTQSILTITSNVVYGKKTGTTPDGRRKGEPFAPGANPMHGRDRRGAVASISSVAKLPYRHAQDGISYTFSIEPHTLGATDEARSTNLIALLDGYFSQGGHHMNVNVLKRETLLDAMEHSEDYPQLTIRVSGYAVNLIKLTREQQLDVIHRTFHERV